MKDEESTQNMLTGKVPRRKEDSFDIRKLSIREFEAFLILLMNDGIEQPILKILIDQEFGYKSPTKGYDHINNICKPSVRTLNDKQIYYPAYAKKKKIKENGRNVTRIYVDPTIREKYDKFILPTISNLNDSLNNIINEYIEGIKEEEKVREKFKTYTETIILALQDLIAEAPVKSLTSQRFQKKIRDTIWRYFRAEILKYEVFSK